MILSDTTLARLLLRNFFQRPIFWRKLWSFQPCPHRLSPLAPFEPVSSLGQLQFRFISLSVGRISIPQKMQISTFLSPPGLFSLRPLCGTRGSWRFQNSSCPKKDLKYSLFDEQCMKEFNSNLFKNSLFKFLVWKYFFLGNLGRLIVLTL